MIKVPKTTRGDLPQIEAIFKLRAQDRATIVIIGDDAIITFEYPEDELALRLKYIYD